MWYKEKIQYNDPHKYREFTRSVWAQFRVTSVILHGVCTPQCLREREKCISNFLLDYPQYDLQT